MSEIQAITVLATLLGLAATVLNLVAFVREKEKSHVRAGVLTLTVLMLLLALFYLPRYAPDTALRLQAHLPTWVAGHWAAAVPANTPTPTPTPTPAPIVPTSTPSPTPTETTPPLQASAKVELERNLLGGISALMARFQFADLSGKGCRVVAYKVQIPGEPGAPPRIFERVLPESVQVPASGTAQSEVELDTEIRDVWLAWSRRQPAQQGPLEFRWDGVDEQGRRFTVVSRNG